MSQNDQDYKNGMLGCTLKTGLGLKMKQTKEQLIKQVDTLTKENDALKEAIKGARSLTKEMQSFNGEAVGMAKRVELQKLQKLQNSLIQTLEDALNSLPEDGT